MSNTSVETIVKTEYKTEALQLTQGLDELSTLTTDPTIPSTSTSPGSDDAFPQLLPP